ncbi:MAG: ribosomal RNA small subunit methyltransferase A [Bdellovibrionales bacterium]|nr:ribosomal RNA small subunit methyltransferase A [Bdellovibrionales bacterium]
MNLRLKIKERLEFLGTTPKRSLGQNFLIDEAVATKIIDVAKSSTCDLYIEIGPGLGSLTDGLLNLGRPLILIELDRALAQFWRDRGLTMVEGDALKLSWSDLPLANSACLVSNLPYQISTHLVVERSVGPQEINEMILMFQKEVAQRLTASPKSKEYGMLSVMAQSYWAITQVGNVGPKSFVPSPKIASRVLRFYRRQDCPRDAKNYLKFLKAAFSQRRKLIWKNLSGEAIKYRCSPSQLVALGENLGLGSRLRAEELSIQAFEKLYYELCKKRDGL